MTFEDAIAALGVEFGAGLKPEDGVAAFTVSDGGGDPVDVTVCAAEDGESADISADLGELPTGGSEELLTAMLEANHLFGGTDGAALSVEGTRAKLERRVPLTALGRGEGVRVVAPFLAMAGRWRAAVARAARGDG